METDVIAAIKAIRRMLAEILKLLKEKKWPLPLWLTI